MEYFWKQQDDIPSGLGYPLFGLIHLLSVLITLLIAGVLVYTICRMNSRKRDRVLKAIPLLMLGMELFKDGFLVSVHRFSIWYLPLHICSIGIFIFLFREYLPWKWAKEFFGELACILIFPSSVAALIFPDWTIYYPVLNFMNLYSYAWHGMLIVYPAILRFKGYVVPSIKRMHWIVLFLCFVTPLIYAFDKHNGCNYFFVNYPLPGTPLATLAAFMGNPGYLIGYAVLVLAVIALVYAFDSLFSRLIPNRTEDHS